MSNQRILANDLDSNLSWDVIGLDLAKNEVSLVGITEDGEIIRIDRLDYETLLTKAQKMSPTIFAMEPCCEENYIANQLKMFGHECRVISGRAVQNYIDTYFSGQKNDLNDAEALAFLGKEYRLKPIRSKTPDEMALQSLIVIREHYVDEYRKSVTALKGIAQSWGLRIGKTISSETKLMALIEDSKLPIEIKELLNLLLKTYKFLQKQAHELTKKLTSYANQDAFCQKLMAIPGLGPVTSTRLKTTIGSIERFTKARKLPAYFGLVPRNQTTGHVQKMGKITKRGDKLARTYMVQASGVLLMLEAQKRLRDGPLRRWIQKKRGKLGYGKLVIALAAKLLRIIWAMLTKNEEFNYRKAGVARCSLPDELRTNYSYQTY
ncbi:MAG: IS110 family transposase [Burkholderiaceae bacterium]|nr:IS110 family transposase [Burkholderiaceae bacterium]